MPSRKGLVRALVTALCLQAGVIPVGAIAPEDVVLWIDAGRLVERTRGDDETTALEAGVRHQRAAVSAEGLAYDAGFFGYVRVQFIHGWLQNIFYFT